MLPENMLDLDRLPPDMREQIMALLAGQEEQLVQQNTQLLHKNHELAHKDEIIQHLEALVKDYKQALYGAKSEKRGADPCSPSEPMRPFKVFA